nr:uncharacterized protein LOC109168888 [Ipomoea batatas]
MISAVRPSLLRREGGSIDSSPAFSRARSNALPSGLHHVAAGSNGGVLPSVLPSGAKQQRLPSTPALRKQSKRNWPTVLPLPPPSPARAVRSGGCFDGPWLPSRRQTGQRRRRSSLPVVQSSGQERRYSLSPPGVSRAAACYHHKDTSNQNTEKGNQEGNRNQANLLENVEVVAMATLEANMAEGSEEWTLERLVTSVQIGDCSKPSNPLPKDKECKGEYLGKGYLRADIFVLPLIPFTATNIDEFMKNNASRIGGSAYIVVSFNV